MSDTPRTDEVWKHAREAIQPSRESLKDQVRIIVEQLCLFKKHGDSLERELAIVTAERDLFKTDRGTAVFYERISNLLHAHRGDSLQMAVNRVLSERDSLLAVVEKMREHIEQLAQREVQRGKTATSVWETHEKQFAEQAKRITELSKEKAAALAAFQSRENEAMTLMNKAQCKAAACVKREKELREYFEQRRKELESYSSEEKLSGNTMKESGWKFALAELTIVEHNSPLSSSQGGRE